MNKYLFRLFTIGGGETIVFLYKKDEFLKGISYKTNKVFYVFKEIKWVENQYKYFIDEISFDELNDEQRRESIRMIMEHP